MKYTMKNGVLTNCEMDKDEYVANVPNNVHKIGRGAFSGNRQVTSIVIPEGVTEIEDGAIEHCSNLAVLTLPYSIRKIGMGAIKWNYYNMVVRVPFNLDYQCEMALRICGVKYIKY